MLDDTLKQQIESEIKDNKVMVYMKGTPSMPQCGFSAQVVRLLDYIGAPYQSRNVLEDEALRQGIKEFSDWPTIPQVYIAGEFVGGCDIMIELAENGELQKMVEGAGEKKSEG